MTVTWIDDQRFESFINNLDSDTAHGIEHIRRVVINARRIANAEGANLDVVIPAAWLHDCVVVPKNSPDRSRASTLAADRAIEYLRENNFPAEHFSAIHHAIAAHSFSAGIPCETLEARVVQDADRLDALGAIGLARCLAVGGQLSLNLYASVDPFCKEREPDDRSFVVDHFFQKLLTLPATMKTRSGETEAEQRVKYLSGFLEQLASEIGHDF